MNRVSCGVGLDPGQRTAKNRGTETGNRWGVEKRGMGRGTKTVVPRPAPRCGVGSLLKGRLGISEKPASMRVIGNDRLHPG